MELRTDYSRCALTPSGPPFGRSAPLRALCSRLRRSSYASLRTAAAEAATSNPAKRRVVEPSCCPSGVRSARFRSRDPGCRRTFFDKKCARRDCFGACGPSSSASLRTAAAPCAAASNLAEDDQVVEPPTTWFEACHTVEITFLAIVTT